MNSLKIVVEYSKKNFSSDYDILIKPMADYSLQLAQLLGADPIICMISSLLHKTADNTVGEFRANKVNAILREFGFGAEVIEKVNNCVLNLIPEHHQAQETIEEKIVGDAYVLTYWKIIPFTNYKFNFYQSEQIFHSIDK